MRNINVTVASNGGVTVTNSTVPASYSGEHNATRLNVTFTDLASSVFSGAEYFRIVFNGRYSEQMTVSGAGFSYDIPQSVTVPPEVRCQISGYRELDGETVFIAKSAVFCFEVEVSEAGEYEVNPDPELFASAMARCEEAVRTAGAYADAISGYATSAAESATSAAGANALAEGYADAAAASAEAASDRCAEASAAAETAVFKAEEIMFVADTVTDVANAIHGHKSGSLIFADDIACNNGGAGLSAAITEYGTAEETVLNEEDLYSDDLRTFSPATKLMVTIDSPFSYYHKGITVFVGTDDDSSEWTPTVISYSVDESGIVCTADFTVEDGMLIYNYDLYYSGYGFTERYSGSSVIPEGAGIVGISGVDDAESGRNAVTARILSEGPLPHTVTVTGRNLLPLYHEESQTVFSDGNFSVMTENGNIVLDGSLSGRIAASLTSFKTAFPVNLPAGTYFLAYCGERLSVSGCSVSVIGTENGTSETVAVAHISSGNELSSFCEFTVEDTKTYHFGISLTGSAGAPLLFSNAVLPVTIEKTFSGQYHSALPITEIIVSENGPVAGISDCYPAMTAFISNGTLSFDYKVDTDIAYRRLVSAINALGGDIAL